jgi:hypothetical protein
VDVAVVVVLQCGVEHVHHELAAARQPQRHIPRFLFAFFVFFSLFNFLF